MSGIAASQPYVIALFLGWAGLLKLLSRRMRARAGQSALARLVGAARAVPALRLVGAVELALAAALLLPPFSPWERAGAALLFTGFLGYLGYAAVAAPTSSCGCLGAHARPVGVRAFARAALLLAAALSTIWTPPEAAVLPSGAAVLAVLAEVAVLLVLSAELDRHWLTPLRRLLVRLRHPLAAPPSPDVPLETSLRALYRSPAYCSVSAELTTDVRETWDEGGMRFVAYGARGRTAVFAIPLSGDAPVLVALVDEPALT